MMPDREKVKRALQACYSADIEWCQAREKGLCDYKVSYCRMALFKDAAELLEAQEPRVMTLEEVLATEVVYAEDIDKAKIIPVLVNMQAYDCIVLVRADGPSHLIHPLISEYGKRWRCWTSRPTDEQRQAVKWK